MRKNHSTGLALVAGIVAGIAAMGCIAAADGDAVPKDGAEVVEVVTDEPGANLAPTAEPVAPVAPAMPSAPVAPEVAPAPPAEVAPVAPSCESQGMATAEDMTCVPLDYWDAPAPVLPTYTLPPCATEDSTGCYWDAVRMGNGVGTSFVSLDGVTYYAE